MRNIKINDHDTAMTMTLLNSGLDANEIFEHCQSTVNKSSVEEFCNSINDSIKATHTIMDINEDLADIEREYKRVSYLNTSSKNKLRECLDAYDDIKYRMTLDLMTAQQFFEHLRDYEDRSDDVISDAGAVFLRMGDNYDFVCAHIDLLKSQFFDIELPE